MIAEVFYCPLTDEDRELLDRVRQAELATIGHLAMRKARIVKAIAERTKKAESFADLVTSRLRAGGMNREVRIELDPVRGVARLFRIDTGAAAGMRPLTDDERQGRLL